MEDQRILWLGYGGVHPAHRMFADSIDADVKNIELDVREGYHNILRYILYGLQLRDYDVIIANEGAAMRSAAPLKLYSKIVPWRSNVKVVRFLANANMFFIRQGEAKRPYSDSFLARFADGAIANSEFTKDNARNFMSGPIKMVLPPMNPQFFSRLPENSPDFGSRKILSVGNASWYKGKDLLVEAFSQIRDDYPNAELVLVGSGTEKYSDIEGVRAKGFVDDVVSEYDEVELFVQPSRGDGFGLTVTEAMRAGIPATVTDTVGASEIVGEVSGDLICEPDTDSIAAAITSFLQKTDEMKESLSDSCREVSERVNPEQRKQEFRTKFEDLMAEIS